MASNNTTLFHTLHSGRLKHRNSVVAAALNYRRGKNRKHSGISSPVNFRQGFVKNEVVSARKLAAGLWQLRFLEFSRAHGSLCSSNSKFEASMPFIKSSKEGPTKWNPSLKKASNEYSTIVHRRKLLENKKLATKHDSIVTVLLEELLQAQNSIKKLKASQNSSKEKIKHILKNIKSMLDELARERKSKEMMELLNTKLVHGLDLANESPISLEETTKEKREKEN
ncbi:uncharacterized protein [Cicer arietinum]|uniref:uncharacterized protein n=1 Tax=Cicer arietinum TaxID=3827 RepID=UPI003CC58329